MEQQEQSESDESKRSIGLVPLIGDVTNISHHSRHSADTDLEDYLLPSLHHQKNAHRSPWLAFLSSSFTRRLRALFLCFLRGLLPSFIHRFRQTSENAQRQTLPPTKGAGKTIKYLDGLRGIACVVVFNTHFCWPYTYTIFYGFGIPSGDRNNSFIHQLPIICLLFRGRAMVVLFFGISGYVLSYRFLSLLRVQAWEASQKSLASMALRRWARLFLPCTVSMMIIMLGAHIGVFESVVPQFNKNKWRTGSSIEYPPRFSTFGAQIHDFRNAYLEWSNTWNWGTNYNKYNQHTWTIPVEFRCSIVLFVSLLARTRLRVLWGALSTLVLTIYCFVLGRTDVAVFLGGSLIADIHLTSAIKSESSTMPLPMSHTRDKLFNLCVWMMSLAGLFALSFPDDWGSVTPGFGGLIYLTPSNYADAGQHHAFWQAIGCIVVLWCLGFQETQQRLFESSVAQYFGKISYALYLVHGPLLQAVGYPLQASIWQFVGGDTLIQWLIGLFLGWCIVLALIIVVADLFWRYVDVVLVDLTKRTEKLMLV